jgi:hypothetical protein
MAGMAIMAVTMAAAEAIWMKDFMTTKPFQLHRRLVPATATFEACAGEKAALMRRGALHNRIFMGRILPRVFKTLPRIFPGFGKHRRVNAATQGQIPGA